jgi:DNA-directed RNA polymerase II subunit RPB1
VPAASPRNSTYRVPLGLLKERKNRKPVTQTTLNTFHYAGVSSKNVTVSVPRIKEIINVATNIKTPSLSVYLDTEIAADAVLAKNIQQELHVTEVSHRCRGNLVPNPSSTMTEEDSVFSSLFRIRRSNPNFTFSRPGYLVWS